MSNLTTALNDLHLDVGNGKRPLNATNLMYNLPINFTDPVPIGDDVSLPAPEPTLANSVYSPNLLAMPNVLLAPPVDNTGGGGDLIAVGLIALAMYMLVK